MSQSLFNVWFIFGLAISAINVFILVRQSLKHLRCTETTQGWIVMGNVNEKEAHLMLTFRVEGEEYRLPFGHSNKMLVGDVVTVVYDPTKINRNSYYIREDVTNMRKVSIICIIGGVFLMSVGYVVYAGWFA